MEPLKCYFCSHPLTEEEAKGFRAKGNQRTNCTRIDDEELKVPICDHCLYYEESSESDSDEFDSSSGSLVEYSCVFCDAQTDGNSLCSPCQKSTEDATTK